MAARRRGKGRSAGRRSQPVESPAGEPGRRRRWLIGLGGVIAVGLGFAGYQLVPGRVAQSWPAAMEVAPGTGAGFNVVLVTLDTMRSDRVGCYGYRGVQTPVMDTLAADGVRFADAVSVVPMTLPAHASIMTGDYPPAHGARDNGTYRLAPEHKTLAERLKAAEYTTAAFIGAFVLDRRFGLDQGFDFYDDQMPPQQQHVNPQRPGDAVTDAAIRWLDEYHRATPEQPFFAWIHLFDPHLPYSPPEPFRSQYAGNPYDGEVAFTDRQVGRFLDKLRQLNLLDKTLVVAVGDHGEGLGDHGESTHSLLIYGSTMRVPLILYCPALIPAGRVVDDRVVAIVDVAPTILDLLGLPSGDCDGVSLLTAERDSDRAVYMETLAPKLNHGWSPLYGLRRHYDKYIEAPTPEYYDLPSDPGELRNLWSERRAERDALAHRLAATLTSLAGAEDAAESSVALDSEAIRKLESLGYIASGSGPESDTLPDPKEMIARSDELLQRANALVAARRPAEAIRLIKGLLSTTPADASLWSLLSVAQTQAGLADDALASRVRLVELQPNNANAWVDLANLQFAQGNVAASRISLAEAEKLEPELGAIFIARALQALYAGQYDEALVLCQEAAKRDPARHTAQSWSLRAKVYEKMNKPDEARTARQRARAAGSP